MFWIPQMEFLLFGEGSEMADFPETTILSLSLSLSLRFSLLLHLLHCSADSLTIIKNLPGFDWRPPSQARDGVSFLFHASLCAIFFLHKSKNLDYFYSKNMMYFQVFFCGTKWWTPIILLLHRVWERLQERPSST